VMQSPNRSTLQPPKARWKVTSHTGKAWLSVSHDRPFQQQVEYGIVHRNLQSSNIDATLVLPRPRLDFARGQANVQHGGVC
jgi:hypothetical protein